MPAIPPRSPSRRWLLLPALLVLALLAWWPARGNDQIVIYRCVDAFGQVTLQNGVPCPKGSKQERRSVEAVQSMPAFQPAPMPMPQAPTAAEDATGLADSSAVAGDADGDSEDSIDADAERLPPPPLYQCHTWDNDRYLSDDGEPSPRCVPMQTVGIGGLPNLAAGGACRMVTDQCERIGDDAACEAWARRAREAEAGWRFAPAELAEQRKAERDRIRRILRESSCAR